MPTEQPAKLPNGFHQALMSSTVFLAGITFAFLKFIVVDGAGKDWSLFAAISAVLAFMAIIIQAETLRRALQLANDDPARFTRTAKFLMGSIWLLLGSGAAAVLSHWWQPWPGLVTWLNPGGS